MRFLFPARKRLRFAWILLAAVWAGCGPPPATPTSGVLSEDPIRALSSRQWITSTYFDRAMGYRGSRFEVVSLRDLLGSEVTGGAEALVLDCRDDYQGLLTGTDIDRYDLRLALTFDIDPGASQPDWLRPFLVIVPDGVEAPFQERFMTANIRRVRPVKLDEYYGPIRRRIGGMTLEVQRGFDLFRDNCLFCHSLEGVGGNKGIDLLARYDFTGALGKERFQGDFNNFHGPGNPDRQNMVQFVREGDLDRLAGFLEILDRNPGPRQE